MICSFFGHRTIEKTEALVEATEREIKKAIEAGCRTFYIGGFGGFDAMCYEIVTRLKEEKYGLNIQRVYCVPQERYLRKKSRYFDPEEYEDIIYLTLSF
ncbi:MAG: hypothetical protein IJX91_01995 [Clostridia bacterium]|nr:hypothetical protein [Clostridia bacterium]